MLCSNVFVAFVEDNATMSSILYFENYVSYSSCAKPKEVDPIKLVTRRQNFRLVYMKKVADDILKCI